MNPVEAEIENEDYQSNRVPRACSCGRQIFKREYNQHLKSGEHGIKP